MTPAQISDAIRRLDAQWAAAEHTDPEYALGQLLPLAREAAKALEWMQDILLDEDDDDVWHDDDDLDW